VAALATDDDEAEAARELRGASAAAFSCSSRMRMISSRICCLVNRASVAVAGGSAAATPASKVLFPVPVVVDEAGGDGDGGDAAAAAAAFDGDGVRDDGDVATAILVAVAVAAAGAGRGAEAAPRPWSLSTASFLSKAYLCANLSRGLGRVASRRSSLLGDHTRPKLLVRVRSTWMWLLWYRMTGN